ncbi:TonB-dependent receptor [Dysgonomonas sp. BGC7]|uniref:SusC/RagA family TonB-linked outer membrane protein n=1 Tax=Dysgonomonas sp. BGC7 TaxID=1658008 RepID=UPI00068288E4|nr:TonB-dependent receptor [Dysgonomonas sp. BGC7]MBD8388399.1 TonB-dependent receptor [Dysgonomonas sp. BGC7]
MNLFKMEKHLAGSLWLLAAMLTLSLGVYAQNGSVTGRISDEKGELLIGVSVQEKGTQNGTVTDINGTYNLKLQGENSILIVSYIGFKPQEVKVNKQNVVDIILVENISSFDEVVVVGYGNQRKVSVVGAQSTLEAKDMKMPVANLSSVISGRIAGVVAVQRSGEPGHDGSDIWIRGLSTLLGQSSSPLVLVDGVERSFSNIDPEDIESFTVLKDASATAVYGVRGANGVVIVKTKPGKVGKPQFSVDYYESFTRLTKKVEMADAYTYMDARNEAQMNSNGTIKYSNAYIEATKKANGLLPNDNMRLYNPYLYPAIDWADELFNDWGHNRRGNISVRGGVPNANYYASVSGYSETGMTRNFRLENYNTQMKYDRYNFTSNLNLKPTSKTTIDLGFSGYLAQGHYPQTSTSTLYAAGMDVNPVIYPLLLPNGTVSGINSQQKFNPYGLLARGGYYEEFSNQLNSNIRVTQDLDFWSWSKGLSASVMVAFDTYNSRRMRYNRNESMYAFAGKKGPDGLYIEDTLFDEETGDYLYTPLREADGRLVLQSPEQWSNRTVYTEASLNYDRSYGNHRVGGLLLYNQKVYWDLNASDVIEAMPYKQRGFAGRATYSWKDRYFAEFNLGINGSENFTPDKRYGVFPAFGIGWAVSNESFWEPIRPYVSFLKFRYTDGWVGSDTATGRRFMYQGVFTNLTGTYFGTNYNGASGYGEEKYGVNVTWSKSRKQDLGIDLKLLNDKLSFVTDLFKERRDNIFLQRSTIPYYAGWIESPYANLGIVENKGFEVSMDYTQQISKKVFLTLRGNLTYNKDKIIENDQPPVDYPWMETRGTNVNARWGFIADGLFTSQDEIDNHATQFGTLHIGDVKYRDLNGDGVIDNYDKTVIGQGDVPKVYYGFGADLQIGDFSISALFQGTAKADRCLLGSSINPFVDDEGRDNTFANITDRWSPDDPTNQNVFYPRLYVGSSMNTNNFQQSTWWQKDVSFLRLKQLNIAYNIPKTITDKLFLKNASIYMMGTNLFTLSKFKLWDPELNTNNGTMYPNVSSYSIGVKFSF